MNLSEGFGSSWNWLGWVEWVARKLRLILVRLELLVGLFAAYYAGANGFRVSLTWQILFHG